MTKLPEANINEFTLDELVNLLPVLELTVQVVPSPNVTCGPLAQVHGLTIDQGPSRRCSMNSVRERTRRHRQVRQSCIEPARNWAVDSPRVAAQQPCTNYSAPVVAPLTAETNVRAVPAAQPFRAVTDDIGRY